jgi:hypothetical protein
MEADAHSSPTPREPAGSGRPAAAVAVAPPRAVPRRRQDSTPRADAARVSGVRLLTALLVIGVLTGMVTGLIAVSEPQPAAATVTTSAGADRPQAPPAVAAADPASVEDLIAVIDADPAAVGPLGPQFRDRLLGVRDLTGDALRAELTELRGLAVDGATSGDLTPVFAADAVAVLDTVLADLS